MMDNKKILEMVMWVAEDDVKDSSRLIEKAEKAYLLEDMEIAKFFMERAKQRIGANFEADHAQIHKVLKEMKEQEDSVDAPDSVQGDCLAIIHSKYVSWVNEIKSRINELSTKIK